MSNHPLFKVIEKVRNYTKENISSSVIFDLDGTLFDNRTRTAFILREIAEKFERKIPLLRNIVDNFSDLSLFRYDLTETLSNFKITNELEIEFIRKEWEKRFFADNSQLLDVPLSGAKQYVDLIHAAGATIIYLTGRDMERMLVGTTESLRQFGFPVGIIGTMIIQKQNFTQSDEFFKESTVNYIKRLGKVVAVFENEPGNINILKNNFPEADCFFVKTQHRPDAPKISVESIDIVDFRF